jgi:hypothetical protein
MQLYDEVGVIFFFCFFCSSNRIDWCSLVRSSRKKFCYYYCYCCSSSSNLFFSCRHLFLFSDEKKIIIKKYQPSGTKKRYLIYSILSKVQDMSGIYRKLFFLIQVRKRSLFELCHTNRVLFPLNLHLVPSNHYIQFIFICKE